MSRLGSAIQTARQKKGWTQKDLADHSGLNANVLARIERGERSVGKKALKRINDAMGTDFDEYGRTRGKSQYTLAEAARLAREAGMSYGEWVRANQGGQA